MAAAKNKKKKKKKAESIADTLRQLMLTSKSGEELYCDCFRIKTGGLFDEAVIKNIELPKFHLKPGAYQGQRGVEEHSSVLVTFLDDTKICKQIIRAALDGIPEFKIEFLDEEDVASTWELVGVQVKAVDLGALSGEPKADLREVQCELSYEHIDIDGITI